MTTPYNIPGADLNRIVHTWRERRDDMSARNLAASSPLAVHAGAHVGMQEFVRHLNTGSNELAKLLGIESAAEAEALGELLMNMKESVFGEGFGGL